MLNLVERKHVWTTNEVLRLRKLFPRATREELEAAFPGLRYRQIVGKAGHLKLRRGQPPLKLTGYPLLDELRDRCRVLGYSMVDLDEMAGTKRYFQSGRWGNVDDARICRAIRAIGGTVEAVWPD